MELRTAIFALAAAGVAVGLARFAGVDAGAALTVFAAALTLAFLALLLAGAAGVVIWRTGRRGAGQAALGCFLSLALLAYPAYLAAIAVSLPMMADVTTDFASPPAFMISAKARAARAGQTPPAWDSADEALQQDAYPKVQPILVDLEPTQAYQLVLRVTKDLGWKVVDSNPPNLRVDGVAQIEAIARSPVFGFADDIAIRVRPLASQTRIDLRSVSRVGRQDFGANAHHFARFAAAVQDALQDAVKSLQTRRNRASSVSAPSLAARPRSVRSTRWARSTGSLRRPAPARGWDRSARRFGDVRLARFEPRQDRRLALAAVADQRPYVALRLAHRSAVAGPVDRLGAPRHFFQRREIGAHRAVGRRDHRGRPRHDMVAGEQRVLFGKREAEMIGGVAGRGDRLEGEAPSGDARAVPSVSSGA